jgi:replicative DNA helicase
MTLTNTTAEKRVLGFIQSKGRIPDKSCITDFSESKHRILYKVFSTIIEANLELDESIICSYFPEQEHEAVKSILNELPKEDENVDKVVAFLKTLTERRLTAKAFTTAISKIGDPAKKTKEIVDELETKLYYIPRAETEERHIIPPQEFEEWYKKVLLERLKGETAFIGTGLAELDLDLSDGFTKGIVSFISGPTSHGKSTMGMFVAKHIATNPDINDEVLYFSPESGADKITDRIISQLTGISIKELRNVSKWSKTDPRWSLVKEGIKELSTWRLHRFDLRGLSSTQLLHIIRAHKKRFPKLNVVFVDNVQDLNEQINWSDEDGGGTQHFALEKMMHKLEVAAQEIGIHICLISQQNRKKKEKDYEYRAELERLRGSGSFEEKGTWIIFVYRPYKDEAEGLDNEIWVTLVKNRDGIVMKTYRYEFLGGQFTIGNFIEHK